MSATDFARWTKNASEVPKWGDRNTLIANLIPSNSRVLDIGAGNMNLRELLDGSCSYQPLDCVKTTPDTIVVDFNDPDCTLEVCEQYDVIVCSGVMEYMVDVVGFLTRIKSLGSLLLISYITTDVVDDRKFREQVNGWINHLSMAEVQKTFDSLQIHWEVVADWERHTIFKCMLVP